MRNALAKTLYELAKADERVVVVVADISPAGAMEELRREFPARFINVGVAEQAMVGLAAGLAMRGMRPFCYTIATFALFRPYEFIRDDLAYQALPVTVVGMGAGLSYSTLGGTHQAVDDVAAAMAIPGMTVLAPSDPFEVAECARWCAGREGGPVYMRIGKAGEPRLPVASIKHGGIKFRRYGAGDPCNTIVLSYGPIAAEALKVAEAFNVDMATTMCVGPLLGALRQLADSYEEVILVEESSGGPLAAELRGARARVESVALPREFPHTHGTREELLAHFGLTGEKIIERLQR